MADRPAARVIPPQKDRSFSPRRVLRGLLLLFAPLIALHAGWGYLADRRLENRIREYRAAGEWVDAADFLGPAVPPDQNAAFDLRAAGRLLEPYDPTFVKADNLYPFLPLTSEETTRIRAAVEKHQAVFALVESAGRMDAIRWDKDYSVPALDLLLPELEGTRTVARLLRRDVLLAHTDGDDRRALRRVQNLIDVGRIQDAEPIDICHRLAHGAGAYTAEELAPDLRIGDAPGAVSVAEIRRVIDQLLDDDAPRSAMTRVIWNKRRDCWVAARAFLAGGRSRDPQTVRWEGLAGYLFKPLLLTDAELTARMATAEARAFARSADWPGFRNGLDLDRAFPEVRAHASFHSLAANYHGCRDLVRIHYTSTGDRHLAASLLALRCYASDHAGQLPVALAGLVPTYLPGVPADPFAPGGAPLRYRSTGDDPIVYSVGEDGRDDGGSQTARAEVGDPEPPLDRWESVDAVAHLRRQPRPFFAPFPGRYALPLP